MKTNFVRVVGKAVAFAESSVLVLHPEQAARRATWLASEKGGKNVYRLLARLVFKAGEVVGIAGDAEVEKGAALHVETVGKADFDAYGTHLAESRAASHTKGATSVFAALAAQLEPTTTEPSSGTSPPPATDPPKQQEPEGGDPAATDPPASGGDDETATP